MNTPYYLIDADAIRHNLEILQGVMDRTGAHILLAQKAFSCYALYPLIGKYLSGATASGLYEARLCHEEMSGKENHIFSPAFKEQDIDEIVNICDHIVFNSIRQLELYGMKAKEHGCQVGLRINPEKSTQEHAIYDPCAPGSRLGVTVNDFREWINSQDAQHSNLDLLDGFHFHTLCEQDSDALEITLNAVEEKFGEWLPKMKWINFGGGHHITRPGYDIERLERSIMRMKNKYGLEVYLEPGEAVALNAGTLHTTVLEVQRPSAISTKTSGQSIQSANNQSSNTTNQSSEMSKQSSEIFKQPSEIKSKYSATTIQISAVILDTSAACHMPDVIEMPYRPPLKDSGEAGEKKYTYTLGGPTCLAGDIIGTYSFDKELQEGDELIFEDMAIYSMVKNNTFNGMPLPSIYIKEEDEISLWKSFSYNDFKFRL